MKKMILTVELEYDEIIHGEDKESIEFFHTHILGSDLEEDRLILWSNCIGDEVGSIKVLEIKK
jgi:hypothetical protein